MNEKNKIIELKHIQLELANERTMHLRHFVDSVYCYKHGYVTRGGRASWKDIMFRAYKSGRLDDLKISNREFISHQARLTTNIKDVVRKEHIIPLKIITSELFKLGTKATLEEIENVIDGWLMFAIIPKEEDRKLNKAGLNSKMSDEFYDKEHELYGDKFSRYKVAGIKLK